jgi:hypothetical protein
MNIPTLTLDTNLLLEYWKHQDRIDIVERLLELAKQDKVDLAVTARIREDIPHPPLADNLNNLAEMQIVETGSVTRLGSWVLGRDMFADEAFGHYFDKAIELASKRGKKPPDWRDWDHLHAHYLLKRDTFLTWDEGILCLAQELKDNFGINITKPDEYLRAFAFNNNDERK